MFTEMNKDEQDAFILSHLQQCRRAPCMKGSYDDHTRRGAVHLRSNLDTLQRIERALCKHFDVNGIAPRIHKLANKAPKRDNVLPPELIEEIVQFIKSFANIYGLPLPGRMPNFKN